MPLVSLLKLFSTALLLLPLTDAASGIRGHLRQRGLPEVSKSPEVSKLPEASKSPGESMIAEERAGSKKAGESKKTGDSKKTGGSVAAGERAGSKKAGESKKTGESKKKGGSKKKGESTTAGERAGSKKTGGSKKKGGSKKAGGTATAKSKSKSKTAGSITADAQFVTLPSPTMSPVKLQPDLGDWIDGCSAESDIIDDCVVLTSSYSNPYNCKQCLQSLAMSLNPPQATPIPNGVKVCVEVGFCGNCNATEVVEFYACGLELDASYVVPTAPPAAVVPSTNATNATQPVVNTTIPSAAIEAITDDINCPALWPGNGTDCVMIDGFNRKECDYPEYKNNATCTCGVGAPNPDLLLWTCVNGPESLQVSTDHGNPTLPIIGGIDAEINSLP